MKLYEIGENEQVQLVTKKDSSTLEYDVTILMNQQNILFIEPIMYEDMVVYFQAEQVHTDIIYVGEEGKPLVWENCVVKHVAFNGKKYHILYSDKDGKKLNRREAFRQYIGVRGMMQIDATRAIKDVIVKDISETGVAVVLEDTSISIEDVGNFHLDFQDRTCRLSVQIQATVVREVDLEDGRRLFGAAVKHSNVDLSEYVAMKQKQEMAKHRTK